jgi:hypothetical protein
MRLSLAIRSPTCFDRRPDHHQEFYILLTVHPEAIMDLQHLTHFFHFFQCIYFSTLKKVKKVRQVGCKSRIIKNITNPRIRNILLGYPHDNRDGDRNILVNE